MAYWLRNKYCQFIWWSACAVIVFRAEIAGMLGFMAIDSIVRRKLGIGVLLKHAPLAASTWLR
jgi:hypothetical protein